MRSGDVLTSNIKTQRNQLMLAAGAELTQALIEKLRKLHKLRQLAEPIYVVRPAPDGPEAVEDPPQPKSA